ncbi:MAG TPA: nucleotidyltransferase and HEPN domain-containing protein [Propylenella sp.]|nr:nucleotidyltransferase and HEPN domain-containing protein [Propylenella sp.]
MRTDLDHLPPAKRRELERVVQILFEEFGKATDKTNGFGKHARIFKIVLYGSYARGDWVDDPIGGYQSDYDILIVVSHDKLTDFVDYWSAAEDRLMRELTIAKSITAPVNFIVHTLKDVNRQLDHGRPFFVDILQQGVALYEAEGFGLHPPRALPPDQARAEAEGYFERWFSTAARSLRTFQLQRAEGDDDHWRRKAAFELHQTTEQLYHCVLLVLTLYSPKSHKLNFLRSQAEQAAPELAAAWPREGKFERRCFELLRLAYVNARYSPEYRITKEELEWLGERVTELQRLVQAACQRRLAPPDP